MARILLGAGWHVQAPPNLAFDEFPRLLDAGIDDWGGVSPVTIDHVNPEAPGRSSSGSPRRRARAGWSSRRGCRCIRSTCDARWLDPAVLPYVRRASDAVGLARDDAWAPGDPVAPPFVVRRDAPPLELDGDELGEEEVTRLLEARGEEAQRVFAAADRLRREVCGDEVSYVVTRNIQYTNVCYFRCGFCAFSKGKLAANLRGAPYLVPRDEIVRRVAGGLGPRRDRGVPAGRDPPGVHGRLLRGRRPAIREAVPGIHVHAFSALEVWQGAATLDISLEQYLAHLRDLGLGSLPGTAAEVLDDEVRRVICPDKVTTAQWLAVHDAAHRVGLRSNVTLMFGHADTPRSWARPPAARARAAARSGGFTEFVPLPFVPMEAPIYLQGRARRGPTFRETLLVHAVARLALHPEITNIQASWVKLGPEGDAAGARSRRERPRRDAHERVDLALRGCRVRAGDAAGADGGAHPLGRTCRRASGRRSTATRPRSACARRSARRRSRSR